MIAPRGWCLFLAASSMLLTSCSVENNAHPADIRPDVLLVTIDTLRADHLGCYGYFRNTSPRIDALARESLLFENAYTPIATTLPAHATMLTGVYPHEHGILANVKHGGARFIQTPGLQSLAQGLSSAGYRSAALVSAAPLKRATGIAAGFGFFREPERHSRPADETVQDALAWLDTLKPGQSFFLWVHLYDPHWPYASHEGLEFREASDAATLAAFLEERKAGSRLKRRAGSVVQVVDEITGYDREIRFADEQLGLLLDHLEAIRRDSRTILILAGDHGEGLGQHGELGHGCIHGEQLHVPLLMRFPGQAPRRIETRISLSDLLPTLLGRLHSPELETLRQQASGVDLLEHPEGQDALFAQRTARDREDLHPFAYVLYRHGLKLEYEPGGEERLFDLAIDPWELRDVAADHPDQVAELRQLLLAKLGAQLERARVLREGVEELPAEDSFDEDMLRQLRSLGYVE